MGNILNKFGCSKHLEFPNGVVVNDRQEIFISDNRAHCVKVFNYDGVYLRQIGGEGKNWIAKLTFSSLYFLSIPFIMQESPITPLGLESMQRERLPLLITTTTLTWQFSLKMEVSYQHWYQLCHVKFFLTYLILDFSNFFLGEQSQACSVLRCLADGRRVSGFG